MRNVCCRLAVVGICAILALVCVPGPAGAEFTDETATRCPGIDGGNLGNLNWGDYNNDGYVDFLSGYQVWKNSGHPTYTFSYATSTGEGVWGDYDNDGRLDVYSCTSNNLYRNQSSGASTSFDQPITMPDVPSQAAGQGVSYGTNRSATWADFNGDSYLDLFVGGASTSSYWNETLMLSNGAASFTGSTLGTPMYTRGVMSCDWDEDGDMDAYACGYWYGVNRLWRNDGNASFTDVAATTHTNVAISGHSIGHAWADIDNDGHFDIFANQFDHGADPDTRFLKNNGPGSDFTFTNKGACGVGYVESYASPAMGDYDNDGDLDVFITALSSYGDTSRFYENNSVGATWHFDEVTVAQGLAGLEGYPAAWADFDNDGDLDLIANQKLFVNDASTNGNHWIIVHLVGDGISVNSAAIGAQARIDVPGLGTLSRQVGATHGETNQSGMRLHFGLGSHADPVTIDVAWPDGTTTTATRDVDQIVTIGQSPSDCDQVWDWDLGLVTDLDRNCHVDLDDIIKVTADWLRCNDPCYLDCEAPVLDEYPTCPSSSLDFEDMALGPLNTSPWSVLDGDPSVVAGGPAPSTKCAELNAAAGDDVRLTLSANDRYEAGTLEFDLYISSGGTFRFTAKDYPDGWRIARFYFRNGGATVDVATSLGGSNLVTGVMSFDTWTHLKLETDNDTEKFSLEIAGAPVYTNMSYNEAGFGHDFSGNPLDRLDWERTADNDILFDNVEFDSATAPTPTFSQSFEAPFATADLNIAPWSVTGGTPTVEAAMGVGNGSNVVNLDYGDHTQCLVTEGLVGTVTMDLYLEDSGTGSTGVDVSVFDGAGYSIAWLRFQSGGSGDADGVDAAIGDWYETAVDVMATDEWARVILDYDCISETFDLTVISDTYGTTLAYDDHAFYGSGGGHTFTGLGKLDWYNVSPGAGYEGQFDNVQAYAGLYTISGNASMAGITMVGLPDCPITAPDGSYRVQVPPGWSGTVTPVPPPGYYSVSPTQRNYSNVSRHHTGDDYVVAPLQCGDMWDLGQGIDADVTRDCLVDGLDFLMIANDWMRCNDPGDPGCEPF